MKRPAPPLAPDTDVRGMPGFVLNVQRLLASELVALATPAEFRAAVLLWCRAWQQRPPASLPDNERVLAGFSGAGEAWPEVREVAMRGFVMCSDGRYYHRTLAEYAQVAARSKAAAEKRREQTAERVRKLRARNKKKGRDPDVTRYETQPVTGGVTTLEVEPTTSERPPVGPQSGAPLARGAPSAVALSTIAEGRRLVAAAPAPRKAPRS